MLNILTSLRTNKRNTNANNKSGERCVIDTYFFLFLSIRLLSYFFLFKMFIVKSASMISLLMHLVTAYDFLIVLILLI